MHYELRLGEIQSLNNVSHVTDTRETGPLPGEPPLTSLPLLIGLDLFMGDVEHTALRLLLLISKVGTITEVEVH